MKQPLLVFDMDGVLVDVTESLPRNHRRRPSSTSPARRITREQIQEYKNQGGWNDDWKLSHHMITETRASKCRSRPWSITFRRSFTGQRHDGLIQRERWIAQPGLLETLERAVSISPSSPAGRAGKRRSLWTASRRDCASHPIIGMDDVTNAKPAPDGLLKIRGDSSRRQSLLRRRHRRRCALRPRRGAFRSSASRRRRIRATSTWSSCSRRRGAYAIVDDINYLDEVFAHENRHHPAQHQRDADRRHAEDRRPGHATRSRPASASSTTCWSCSPSTAASI